MGWAGYPAIMLMGLLDAGMLVLADGGFDGNAFPQAVAGTKAQFLVRGQVHPPATGAGGAARLVQLYHERWEIESAYYALRHTLAGGRVLRSHDQPGLKQELWGLLATYQVLRMAMADTAEAAGLDPDRASFTIALEAARDTLSNATGILPTTAPDGRIDLAGAIGRAILAHPLPARRARYSARKVKSPISRYHARPAGDDRPLVATSIATVTTEIHPLPPNPLPPHPPRRRRLPPGIPAAAPCHGARHNRHRRPPAPRRTPSQARRG
jgi:hypothetical protein